MSKELGIYIHWPFCKSKCPYCAFNSSACDFTLYEHAWKEGILHEIKRYHAKTATHALNTIYFGGGTPSLIKESIIEDIIHAATTLWKTNNDLEITLEANPESSSLEKFQHLKQAGVNRLSIGVQSLRDQHLAFLGRIHDRQRAIQAVDAALSVFDNVSLDFMYGLPNQTTQAWKEELLEILSIASQHLSLYLLTIEPRTPFAKKRIEPSKHDEALYDITQELTTKHNKPAYEVSSHALEPYESKHNLIYWQGFDYVGVGPGAHGRITMGGKTYATEQIASFDQWRSAITQTGAGDKRAHKLSTKQRLIEKLIMALRTNKSIRIDNLGIDISRVKDSISYDGQFLRNTDLKRADAIIKMLI